MSTMETYLTRSGPMSMPVGQPASFEAWQALVAPGNVFRHPREVLAHPQLTSGEKRVILTSWASDACALENTPRLRCLAGAGAEPVSVDTVLATLAELDRGVRPGPPDRQQPRKRSRGLRNLRQYVRCRRDDDNEPPPCPAVAMPRPRTPPGAASLGLCLTA